MLLDIAIIVGAFVVLIQGASYFVLGSASISRKLGISALVVGLTIVAIGTSAPELFVNVIAAAQGNTDLSISNILGSNLANTLLALGIAAVIIPLSLRKGTVWKEIPFSLMGAILILVFGSDILLGGSGPDVIGRVEGIALLAFFIIFIVYTFGLTKVEKKPEERIKVYSWTMSLLYTLGGIAALAIGGKLVVDHAVSLASTIGISENLIGLTVVAVGTSLPEIVTVIAAVRKKLIDLAVGGIVGSNIFNVLLVLGITALVRPLPFSAANVTDSLAVVVATVLLFAFMFVGRRHCLERWHGIAFIMLYVLYILFAIWRG